MLEDIKPNSKKESVMRKLLACVEKQNGIILELTDEVETIGNRQKVLIRYLEDLELEITLIEEKIGMHG